MQANETKDGEAIARRTLLVSASVVLLAVAATFCNDREGFCRTETLLPWFSTSLERLPIDAPPADEHKQHRAVGVQTASRPKQPPVDPVRLPLEHVDLVLPDESFLWSAPLQWAISLSQEMADNLLVTWLAVVGALTVILGLCLMYALCQVTVLREQVDELTISTNTSKALLEERVKEANARSLEVVALSSQSVANTSATTAADHAEIVVKLRSLEKELAGQQSRMTDFIQRAQAERALSVASPARATEQSDASFSGMVGGSPKLRAQGASPITDADASFSLEASQSMARTLSMMDAKASKPGAAVATRSVHRGLGFSLPSKMWVYERVSGDPRDCVMKKRLHSIALGHNGDVNTPGEVCFLFAAVDATRSADWGEMMAEAARNRSGAAGVTCIPANSVLLMEVKPAPRDLVEAMGPVAGDGQNLLVSIHRSSVNSTTSSLTTAPQTSRTTASWNAFESSADTTGLRGGASSERSATLGAGRLDRRAFLRTTSTGTAGHAVSDRPFVFFIPSSIASEEWVTFVGNLLHDRVKIVDGSAASAFFEL